MLYIEDTFKVQATRIKYLPYLELGMSYTVSGYGKKIPTRYQIKILNRWHRIYCCIYSNSGIYYILKGNKTYLLQYDSTIQ